jgi:MFS family permease
METLFAGLAKTHGVEIAAVRHYSRQRDAVVDTAVILGFAFIYIVVAYLFAGRIRRRFPPGEPGFWVMALTMAVGVSLVGVLSGIFGSIIVEEYRLNTNHLSFRMFRIPFRQHWVILFVCGVIIFVVAALLRYYKRGTGYENNAREDSLDRLIADELSDGNRQRTV